MGLSGAGACEHRDWRQQAWRYNRGLI